MQADDIYRFVGLRQPASIPPDDLHDPFIAAYSYQSQPSTDSLRYKLAVALSEGNPLMARADSLTFLQSQSGRDAWARIDASDCSRLFLALPDLVRRGNIDAVTKAVMKAFGVARFEDMATHVGKLAAQREQVADYFAACALSGWPSGDLDGAAHLICCFETLERLLDVADQGQPPSLRRAAWQVPLAHGVVVLPFSLHIRQEAAIEPPPTMVPTRGGDGDVGIATPTSFIGDLIVLKQQLRRYELGEIAHVENVLAREHLDRTHRTLRRTENKLLAIEETENENNRDQQSTTRDELSSEIQNTIAEQLDLSVNFNVTATYMGPGMTVTGSVGGAAGYRRASEERTATAKAHSHEVVSRASERVRRRTLTQREKIETSETEQRAVHGFENDTAEHIVGVYRWLERCFDLHLVNYGRRLIYEFVLPEPASYWSALVGARGDAKSGQPPPFPQFPTEEDSPTMRALVLDDLSLIAGGTPIARPARWAELVELAGEWGVALENIPPPTVQVHFALHTPAEAKPDTETLGNPVGNDAFYSLESAAISTVSSQEPLTIPAGYRATAGFIAMHGWRYMRKSGTTYKGFEGGEAHVQLNGKDYKFSEKGDSYALGKLQPRFPPQGADPTDVTFSVAKIILENGFIEGEVPVLLTTSLNGLTCSIQLDCERTEAHGNAWSQRMFSLFAAAHADRLARYEDDKSRALIGNDDWAGALPAQTAREIEQRELKRGVLTTITKNGLMTVGDRVLQASQDAAEPAPTVAVLQSAALATYERIVRFFEMAFDWNNLAYIFSPYFYGRRKEWARLALADNADAQFKAFLSAGAARVQVPVRPGYEAHVTYFFDGLGLPSFEQRVPWLASMRPIAEDLAAGAREGFDVGAGKVSVVTNSNVVTGVATLFRNPADLDREIRLDGEIYVIRDVRSATEVEISPTYKGTALNTSAYELGGIVVGPAFPLKLATTLVAIDKQGLTLPTYRARYAE
jgi:hypothetical protein